MSAAIIPGAHQYSTIFGVDTHTLIRVAIPLLGGALSFGAFVFYARGNHRVGQMLLASWAGISALSAAALVLEESYRNREAAYYGEPQTAQSGTASQAAMLVV